MEVFLGYASEEPHTVAEWIELAIEVKAKVGELEKIPAQLAGKGHS